MTHRVYARENTKWLFINLWFKNRLPFDVYAKKKKKRKIKIRIIKNLSIFYIDTKKKFEINGLWGGCYYVPWLNSIQKYSMIKRVNYELTQFFFIIKIDRLVLFTYSFVLSFFFSVLTTNCSISFIKPLKKVSHLCKFHVTAYDTSQKEK